MRFGLRRPGRCPWLTPRRRFAPGLAVWRRMRDDPFLVERFTVTEDPPVVGHYLSDGHPGVARFLADFLGSWFGEDDAEDLLDLCRRAGLRPPLSQAECEAALKGYPDPQEVFDFYLHALPP